MTWRHGIIRHVCAGGEGMYEIAEIYHMPAYAHGKPFMTGESLQELELTVSRMQRAVYRAQDGTDEILDCKCELTKGD